jgi:AcrR family transcriptional regulator
MRRRCLGDAMSREAKLTPKRYRIVFSGSELKRQPDSNTQAHQPFGDRYAMALKSQTLGLGGESKSARTRAKLKLAAVECLTRGGLKDFSILKITRRAKVASGTFYLHFKSTKNLALEIFSEFIAIDLPAARPRGEDPGNSFGSMEEMFLPIVSLVRRRRRLFAALFQMRAEDEEINKVWLSRSRAWANELSSIAVDCSGSQNSQGFNRFIGHAASGLADEMVRQIYIDEIFGAEYADDPASDAEVAEWMSYARHRLLLGTDPKGDRSNSKSKPRRPAQDRRADDKNVSGGSGE